MTDEEKITKSEETKECECKTCKCCEYAKKFLFLTGAIFLGTLLALLTAHCMLKPKFHHPPMGIYGPRAGIECPFKNHHRMMPPQGKFQKMKNDFQPHFDRQLPPQSPKADK